VSRAQGDLANLGRAVPDTRLPVKDIAALLGVNSILEGGVAARRRIACGVTVQLIDAATDAHLWRRPLTATSPPRTSFAIQSEVAAADRGGGCGPN